MFAGDVGGEEGEADGDPADAASGEEVVFGVALFEGVVGADCEDDQEVDDDYGCVEHWGLVYIGLLLKVW